MAKNKSTENNKKMTDEQLISGINKYMAKIPKRIGDKEILTKSQRQQITMLLDRKDIFAALKYESKEELYNLLKDFYTEYIDIANKIVKIKKAKR